jgi:hypothetical protein
MSRLEETFQRVNRNLRLRETWKLQLSNLDLKGVSYCVWDGMSEEDRQFNLVWNELRLLCKNMSTEQIMKVLDSARGVLE